MLLLGYGRRAVGRDRSTIGKTMIISGIGRHGLLGVPAHRLPPASLHLRRSVCLIRYAEVEPDQFDTQQCACQCSTVNIQGCCVVYLKYASIFRAGQSAEVSRASMCGLTVRTPYEIHTLLWTIYPRKGSRPARPFRYCASAAV